MTDLLLKYDIVNNCMLKGDCIGDLVVVEVPKVLHAILFAKLIRAILTDCSKLRFDLAKSGANFKMTIRRIK